MPRIISTPRLAELNSLADALPFARSKAERLEKDLDAERRRSQGLQRELEQAREQSQQEQATTARACEERLATARRSVRLGEHLLDQAQGQADEKVRELKGEIEQLKAKLPHPTPNPEGVVARYQNLVGALIDLTLFVTEDTTAAPGYSYSSKCVDLKLVSLCSGCGYRQEETREQVYDTPEARTSFLDGLYDGAKLKRWAQEHAETCRAVALPLRRAA
ncbi:hypothetical protein ACH4FE_35695 [Streptomyces celluloflavus]|uniref:hypothetical protein n=1 Tax=Streptomyces celluloflavus TaxID=58344 RepID=UPI0037881A2E